MRLISFLIVADFISAILKYMLSAFPQLFAYSLFAVAGLRILFGVWFIAYAYNTLSTKETQADTTISWLKKGFIGVAFLVGGLAVIGLFTQIAALLGLFLLLTKWYMDVRSKTLTREIFEFGFYIAVIGLALLFLGPGVPAIDLPL